MLSNPALKSHVFVQDMVRDSYFPAPCVKVVQEIFRALCEAIEEQEPANLDELYALTHKATESINDAEQLFADHDSEIETGARDAIGAEFHFIAESYGFEEADIEELIAPRSW